MGDAEIREPPPIRVLLVMDVRVVRQGIAKLLQDSRNVILVGEADSVEEGLLLAKETRPEVILTLVSLPEFDPIALSTRLDEEVGLQTPVLVLSRRYDEALVVRAIRSPLVGYIDPTVSIDVLIGALYLAREGMTILAPAARRTLVNNLSPRPMAAPESRIAVGLTQREQEVLGLMLQGLMNKEIAQALGIVPRTVEMHVAHIIEKLGAHSRISAVIKALHLYQSATGVAVADLGAAPSPAPAPRTSERRAVRPGTRPSLEDAQAAGSAVAGQ